MARSDALARLFEHPTNAVHRRFEICRAYFLHKQSASAIAQQFNLHVGTVQAMVRDFAANPDLNQFFRSTRPGRKHSPKREAIVERAAVLRAQGKKLSEIRQQLDIEGHEISESYLAAILHQEEVSQSTQRHRIPQPGELACDGSVVPAIADVNALSFEPERTIATQVAGLFLFVPLVLESHFPQAVKAAGYPGSAQIPALQAMLSLVTPKLVGKRRVSHISDLCSDEGAGLFAGMNVLPKTTYATDYSYRTDHTMNQRFVDELITWLPFPEPPLSFNIDFHAIPFRGYQSDLENHWVPKTHRGQPAVMAFVAQESTRRILCYATANLLRSETDAKVIQFVDHWKELTGHYPARVLFDSRATTYAHLNELNERKVGFITIRRRGAAMLKRVQSLPARHWRRCQVDQAKGKRRSVKYFDETVRLDSYDKPVRQIVFDGLGHDKPTFLLTNDLPEPLSARETLQTYASRNHVEHSLGEKITFFHLDCLASDVRLNIDFDLTLTVVAAMLYHQLASRVKGYADSTPQKLFRKFVNTQGHVHVSEKQVLVHFEKRAHNPILKEAGFNKPTPLVPWLNNLPVNFEYAG